MAPDFRNGSPVNGRKKGIDPEAAGIIIRTEGLLTPARPVNLGQHIFQIGALKLVFEALDQAVIVKDLLLILHDQVNLPVLTHLQSQAEPRIAGS